MRRFESVEELGQAICLETVPDRWGGSVPGFRREADWAHRLEGYGLPGGASGGWLVTRAFTSLAPGALIAYAILNGKKSGECLLLAQPWPEDVDKVALAAFRASDNWRGRASQGGEATIESLTSWLEQSYPDHRV